jgi:hypothetical protein
MELGTRLNRGINRAVTAAPAVSTSSTELGEMALGSDLVHRIVTPPRHKRLCYQKLV